MELELPKIKFTKKSMIIIIILISFLTLILVYSLFWFINYNSYKKYNESVLFINEDKQISTYADYENGYTYLVAKPTYPQFAGNLAISPHYTSNLTIGENIVDIIIWPKPFGHFKVGITISTITEVRYLETIDSWNIETTSGINVLLDENMQPTDENTEESLKAYDEYTEDIKRAYKMAYDMWGILEIE